MVREVVKRWDDLNRLMDDIHEARNYFDNLEVFDEYDSVNATWNLKDANGNHVRFPLQLTADVTFFKKKEDD